MTINDPNNVELCILIPCYNNFTGLVTSINSIKYDLDKFIILIVDDGSSNPIVLKDLAKLVPKNFNLRLRKLDNNLGITKALNKGLDYLYDNCKVKYIARLDCDDVCDSNRFYRQIDFLDNNSSIALVGSWCYFKDKNNNHGFTYKTPVKDADIRKSMYFRNVFIHPTVIWRLSELGKIKYPEQFPFAEDYALFYLMISKIKCAIIDEFLVTCQINSAGISIKNRQLQLESRLRVISFYSKNRYLLFLGSLKLKMLMFIPYHLVLIIKKMIFR